MSTFVYGHAGGRYTDALATIKQYIRENGTQLSLSITTTAGQTLYPAVLSTSQRNVSISAFTDGLEMIIHEVNSVENEETFDGRIKNTPKFKFSIAAYGVFGADEMDLAISKLAEEYENAPQLQTTYQSYSAYAAAIGDTHNTNPANFVKARTYTLLCGTTTITGPESHDIFTKSDLQKLLTKQATNVNVALSTDATIYADAQPASPDPGGTGGWYYTNAAGQKINWYFKGVYPGAPGKTTLGELSSLFMTFYPRTANTKAPYVALYTRPQGDGNDAAYWYRSRIVYTTNNQSWTQNQPVLLYVGNEPAVDEDLVRYEQTFNAGASLGPMSPDEDVYLATVGSDSAAAAGAYNFATTKVGYVSELDGTILLSLIGLPEVPAGDPGSGAVDSVNGLTGVVVLTADNIDDSTSLHQFVTSAQKNLINSSVQPGDNVGDLTNDAGYLSSVAINDLTDVDTYTVPPVTNQALVWTGTKWAPANQAGTGTTTREYYVPANGLSVNNSTPPTWKQFKNVGASTTDGALQLISDYVTVPAYQSFIDTIDGTTKQFTIEFWIKPTRSVYEYICSLGTNAGIRFDNNAGSPAFRVDFGSTYVITSPIQIGAWNHCVFVVDKSINSMTIYVNGSGSTYSTGAGDIFYQDPIELGVGSNSSGTAEYTISEFTLYNMMFDATQVNARYNGGTGTTSLPSGVTDANRTLHLTYSDTSGNTVTNTKGSNGTIHGTEGVTFNWTTGPIGGPTSFGVFLPAFSNAAGQYAGMAVPIPDDWVLNTTLLPHLHFSIDAPMTVGQTITFELEYTVAREDELFGDTQIISATYTADGTEVAGQHLEMNWPAITVPGSVPHAPHLVGTIVRSSVDTYASDVYYINFGLAYTSNRAA